MATPTIIGTNTQNMRLSDVATDATDPGKFAWYFDGLIGPETWDFTPIVDVETIDDFNIGVQVGMFRWSIVIKNVSIKTKAQMDLVKRACRYWNEGPDGEGPLLYFQNKIGGTDEAYWSNTTWAAADEKIRVRVIKVVWNGYTTDDRLGTIYLKRYTE